jgi:hypothetical protein
MKRRCVSIGQPFVSAFTAQFELRCEGSQSMLHRGNSQQQVLDGVLLRRPLLLPFLHCGSGIHAGEKTPFRILNFMNKATHSQCMLPSDFLPHAAPHFRQRGRRNSIVSRPKLRMMHWSNFWQRALHLKAEILFCFFTLY